ncbi:MAG TPA: DEAD/DEAH box helicase family protein [Polyangiaceae bacterium]
MHLRPYQEEAVREIELRIVAGKRRVLVVAPTGAGKTVVFARVIADAVLRGQRTLVIAHRRELVHQTCAKLLEAGLAEDQIGILMASDRRHRSSAPVQVASIDTLRRRTKPDADLVIRDEAHRALARTDLAVAALYPDAVHLGFTATPFRADRRSLGEFYDDLLVVSTIRNLIAQGYLVEPRVFTVPSDRLPDLSGVRVRGGDYAQDQLDEAVDQGQLVGNIIEHWAEHARGVRTVAFAVSVKHSEHIVERFRAEGVAAEHVDATTPATERDGAVARLLSGVTLLLSNVGVFCEGTDLPPVKCAVLARPTKSTGLYLQQAGRILRPWEGARAIILDHAGCAREHGLPQDDREFSLEPRPKRDASAASEISIRACPGCYAVLPGHTRVCPECGTTLVESREQLPETSGRLVEVDATEQLALQIEMGAHRRIGWSDTRKRVAFEQLRALARARQRGADWVRERFEERFGGPPHPEWADRPWAIP